MLTPTTAEAAERLALDWTQPYRHATFYKAVFRPAVVRAIRAATASGDKAAAIAGDHNSVIQLPAITYGCSHEHAAFPGTVSISATTLSAVIADITESCAHQGITALLIVNAHGGNAVLTNVAQRANVHGPLRIGLYPSREDWAEARTAAGISSTNHADMHAGELETSILLAAYCAPAGTPATTAHPIVAI